MSTENLISADETQKLLDAATRPNAGCTGVSAGWCPIHGDCLCRSLPVTECPLHAADSTHAEGDATALRESAETLARTVIALHAEVARLTTTNVDLLAILEGRTAPPTLREIAAHPGEWLVDGEIVGLYFEDDRDTDLRARLTNEGVTYRDASARLWLKHAAEERRRWVAIDAEGRPCAWPVVSG